MPTQYDEIYMLPKQLNILDIIYQVREFDEPARDDVAMGKCDTKRGIISICKSMSPEIIRETMIHEIIHAINDQLGLKLSEEQITAMGQGVYSVIKNNSL